MVRARGDGASAYCQDSEAVDTHVRRDDRASYARASSYLRVPRELRHSIHSSLFLSLLGSYLIFLVDALSAFPHVTTTNL